MKVESLATQTAAQAALVQYRGHRDVYDKRDWEIERIYRAISKGKLVISAFDAIRQTGLDTLGRPRLAIARADDTECYCSLDANSVTFSPSQWSRRRRFVLPWPEVKSRPWNLRAPIPRIPPQHRPMPRSLKNYHLLWEVDWQELPRDPMLLKRIGKDAWVVLAAWDLTEVELSVLRARWGQ
jgi:hypothetical protein